MSVFDLDQRGAAMAVADSDAVRLDQVEPTFGYRAAYGFGMGVMRGAARVGQAVGMAGAVIPTLLDNAFGTGTQFRDSYFRDFDSVLQNAVDYWTPKPEEVGTAGRLLGGLAEIVAPLAAGGGNPALLLGAQGLGSATDLAREGVDPMAAAAVGTVQAAATAVGFRIPFIGRNVFERVAGGAAGNLATNIPADAASQAILERAGARQQAERFDPLNVEARVLDIVTGGVFGGVAHLAARAEAGDAARVAANARRFQQDSAPRLPQTVDESVAHQRAIETAIDQMARGERVAVPPEVASAFDAAEVRARPDMLAAVREAVEDFPDPVPPAPRPTTFENFRDDEGNASVLRGLAKDAGWAERGGQLLRVDGTDQLSEVAGRTQWIGADWFMEMRRALEGKGLSSEKQIAKAVDKYLTRAKLTANERRTVEWMIDYVNRMDAATQDPALSRAMMGNGLGVADVVDAQLVARAAAIDEGRVERLAIQYADDDAAFMAGIREIVGDTDGRQATTDQPGAGAGAGGEGRAASPDAAIPEFAAARDAAARVPDLTIRLDDGTEARAADVLARIEVDLRQAQNDSQAFGAAVRCFLGA